MPRKRIRTAPDSQELVLESCSPVLDGEAGACPSGIGNNMPSGSSSSSSAHSPRTRSRGTVNINLWTLDVKPLLPTTATASPSSVSPKAATSLNKPSSDTVAGVDSASPMASVVTNGSCDSPPVVDHDAAAVKLSESTDAFLDAADQDLDVTS